jgi:hypothetical protein
MRHKIADRYYRVASESVDDMYDRGVTAGLLNNFAKIMDSDLGQALTTSQDFGPYVMEVWPLVTAWYAEFPLKDLISVQDMDKPLAYMFFSKLMTGTNKSDTVVGEVVETATGSRTIKGKYPTGEIIGETIQGADIKFDGTGTRDLSMALLAYAPLNIEQIPGYYDKIKIDVWNTGNTTTTPSISLTPFKIAGDVITLGYDNSGTFTETKHTLDVKTGLFTFDEGTSASATTVLKIVANYVWNLDYATTENIQTIKEQVELRPMEATPRALMLEWTLFSEYLKKSQFGQDIRESNTKRMLSLLYQYQVRYILDEMWTYAGVDLRTNSANDITIPGGTAVSVDVKAQQVSQALKNLANMIEINSGRIEGNRIVCGKNLKSFLESLPSTLFQISKSATDYGFSTPRELGTYGTFKVYYDPNRAADEAMMTYRGSEFYDASYYLGEYMPCVPTDAIALGVTVRSSFVSMEAYRFDKKNCVIKFKVVNG